MTIVFRRNKDTSLKELHQKLGELCSLLVEVGEDEAIEDLEEASKLLVGATKASKEVPFALKKIHEAFGDKHELDAYILQNIDANKWTKREQLSSVAVRVKALAQSLK